MIGDKDKFTLLTIFVFVCISIMVYLFARNIGIIREDVKQIKKIVHQIDLKKMKGPIYLDPDQNMILIKLSENGIDLTVDPNFIKTEER